MTAAMADFNDTLQRKLGTVTIFFNKKSQLPPVYIASSMSGWFLQEMKYTIDQGDDFSSFKFSHQFCNVPEGRHQYKFKFGLANINYAIDDSADTGLDEAGNVVNVIDVSYDPPVEVRSHWEQIPDDDTSYRIVDAEISSVNATGHDVGNFEQDAYANVQPSVPSANVHGAASCPQPDAKTPYATSMAESCIAVPQRCLTVEQHVKVVASVMEKLSERLSDRRNDNNDEEESLLLASAGGRTDLDQRLPSSWCRSPTEYWNASAALADDGEAVSADGDGAETLPQPQPQAQRDRPVDATKMESHADARHTAGRKMLFRLPGSPTVPWHSILQLSLWLAVGAVFAAIFGVLVWPAFAAPDL